MFRLFYEHQLSKSVLKKHTLSLTYDFRIIEDGDEFNLGEFMEEYIEKVLINGFMPLQGSTVRWTRITISRLMPGLFEYRVPSNLYGSNVDKSERNKYYQFALQPRNGLISYLKLYGVSSNCLSEEIERLEQILISTNRIANCDIELRGLRTYSSDHLLSVVGEGFKSPPTRKTGRKTIKRKVKK